RSSLCPSATYFIADVDVRMCALELEEADIILTAGHEEIRGGFGAPADLLGIEPIEGDRGDADQGLEILEVALALVGVVLQDAVDVCGVSHAPRHTPRRTSRRGRIQQGRPGHPRNPLRAPGSRPEPVMTAGPQGRRLPPE